MHATSRSYGPKRPPSQRRSRNRCRPTGSALNEQTNVAEARLTALHNHVPITVLIFLTEIAMLSLGFAGYNASPAASIAMSG